MNEDGKFWYNIWQLVAVTIILITLFIIVSCQTTNKKIAEGIKNGGDPMQVACAYSGLGTTSSGECMLYAVKTSECQ